jgi:hypothetical protein
MARLSEVAIRECVAELRAACRRPIDDQALDVLLGGLRSNFERILDDPDGGVRWSDHGQRMRDNGRFIGALADFFGNHLDSPVVGIEELTQAFEMVRAACKVGIENRAPGAPLDASPAAKFLRAISGTSSASL